MVEFDPPQDLRPAQLGLILDESADTKDVTATIVDLAVRSSLPTRPANRSTDVSASTENPTPRNETRLAGSIPG